MNRFFKIVLLLVISLFLFGCTTPEGSVESPGDATGLFLKSWLPVSTKTTTTPIAISCSNDVQDGDETDIDCGGPTCLGCEHGQSCLINDDCVSDYCDPLDLICGDLFVDEDTLGHLGYEGSQDFPSGGSSYTDSKDTSLETVPLAPAHCSNGIQDKGETGVDCGGECPACADTGVSGNIDDLTDGSGAFPSGGADSLDIVPVAPLHCNNGVLDSDETGIDCGGSCPACEETDGDVDLTDGSGAFPSGGADSLETVSDSITLNHCYNGIWDADESDVDCGGSCDLCEVGRPCLSNSDCVSDNCVVGVCADPVAAHGLGDNLPEPQYIDDDDQPTLPSAEEMARPTRVRRYCSGVDCCTNGILDGAETDIDCGGPDCGDCEIGQSCLIYSDCAHYPGAFDPDGSRGGYDREYYPDSVFSENIPYCLSGVCTLPCNNGLKDGNESDMDCGGPMCQPCSDGSDCRLDNDCLSYNCSWATIPHTCVTEDSGFFNIFQWFFCLFGAC